MKLFECFNRSADSLKEGCFDSISGVVIISHPRSGTHLTIDLIRRNFPTASSSKPLFAPLDALYVSLDALLIEMPEHPGACRAAYGMFSHRYPIIKTHWLDPDFSNLRSRMSRFADWIDTKAKKIYVVRQPERVLSSLFVFEGLDASETLADRDAWLLEKAAYWANHVECWTERNDITTFRFEDLIAHPIAAIERMSSTLGLEPIKLESPLPSPTCTLGRNRLLRFSTRPTSTEVLSLSKPPELAAVFSEEALTRFNEVVRPMCERFRYI